MPDHAATEEAPGDVRRAVHVAAQRLLRRQRRSTCSAGALRDRASSSRPPTDRSSWTAHADLAEAAAVVLADEGRFDGPTPPLTAPEALDLEDIAAIVTELTGRTIRRVVADDEEWTAAMIGHGVPADPAGMLLGMFHAARRGEFSTTGPELENLLQRPATPVRSILEGLTTRPSSSLPFLDVGHPTAWPRRCSRIALFSA